jgi:hypothetical protein
VSSGKAVEVRAGERQTVDPRSLLTGGLHHARKTPCGLELSLRARPFRHPCMAGIHQITTTFTIVQHTITIAMLLKGVSLVDGYVGKLILLCSALHGTFDNQILRLDPR